MQSQFFGMLLYTNGDNGVAFFYYSHEIKQSFFVGQYILFIIWNCEVSGYIFLTNVTFLLNFPRQQEGGD